jgi:hypothetical protein
MSDITSIDQSYHLDGNVEIGKFTCLIPSTTNYADGALNPGGANVQCLGVAQESILPDAVADYSGGQYGITSGTAWPTNSIPSSGQGRNIRVRQFGISRVVANAAITRGALVNIAGANGYVKTVSESGTTIYPVGIALDTCYAQGDVIRVLVNTQPYKG